MGRPVLLHYRRAAEPVFWSDGTRHLRFKPVEMLERLAVLIPRPRVNLILYHGALGPRAASRSDVVCVRHDGEAGRGGCRAA